MGRRRCAFVVERCSLVARCLILEPRVGLDFRRGADAGARPELTSSASLARAISRLRSCERCSEAAMVISLPFRRRASRVSRRFLSSSRRTAEVPMFHESSARLSEVFTCCPPGPDDRENRQASSEAGIVSVGDTSRSMPPASHEPIPPSCTVVIAAAQSAVILLTARA